MKGYLINENIFLEVWYDFIWVIKVFYFVFMVFVLILGYYFFRFDINDVYIVW